LKRVYILSVHDEYGAENVSATLDPSRLPRMASRYTKSDAELAVLVAKIEAVVAGGAVHSSMGESLQLGWGGLQLHVVDLDESKEPD
jgi:hypothetical protein